MKTTIKNLIKKLPFDLSRNHGYDRQTITIIKKVCKINSNCIDVGCHKGEVLDIILKYSPKGNHFGFEPIPLLFENLKEKYKNTNCQIFDYALSSEAGTATFNYVVSNPAYSGLIKRNYDKPNEVDKEITVQKEQLDKIIDLSVNIDLIKIDVEGGELGVLEGAVKTIYKNRPIVIFEHGLGASEFYGSTPEKVFQLFEQIGYKINLMKRWLNGQPEFTLDELKKQYYDKLNYYFIAYPKEI